MHHCIILDKFERLLLRLRVNYYVEFEIKIYKYFMFKF